MATTQTPALPKLIAGYADRMHRHASGHHILSPLGAWLLLALVGPASRDGQRERLEEVLGTDVETAAGHAITLLREPHPAVGAAVACWAREAAVTPALAGWFETLPESTELGDLPTQAEADAWANRVTRGLIPVFPLQIEPETVLVLATALATRISWQRPFELADAADLDDAWGPEVRHVLRSVITHRAFVAETQIAGLVGVHAAGSASGLEVVSAIAAESVSQADAIAAAHEVACKGAEQIPLSELPIGDGHAWTVTEREAGPGHAEQNEKRYALLPAWHARTQLALTSPALGFAAAADSLMALLAPGNAGYEAAQSAVASYSREGFEAAAITAFGMAVSLRAARARVRDLEVRFARPYAVVAVTRFRPRDGASRGEPWDDPWWSVPVFSGWIERADNAG